MKPIYGIAATLYGAENLTAWDTGGKIRISVKAKGIEETAVNDLISPPTGPAALRIPLAASIAMVAGSTAAGLSLRELFRYFRLRT